MIISYKRILSLATALTCLSSQSYALTVVAAQNQNAPSVENTTELKPICRGEFSENIIETVKKCSTADLSRAYIEILLLEQEIKKTDMEFEKALHQKGKNGLSHNSIEKIAVTSGVLAISGLFGAAVNMITTQPGVVSPFAKASFVTGLMASVIMLVADQERRRIEIEIKDIPRFQKRLTALRTELDNRKALLEAAIEFKKRATSP